MALALPALAPVVAAVSELSQGPSPAATIQLDAALDELGDLLVPAGDEVRAYLFAGADADVRTVANLPGDAAATRRAMRGIYTLSVLGVRLQGPAERDAWVTALALVASPVPGLADLALLADEPSAGLVELGAALWKLSPPVVVAGFVSDAAAGKLPEPLARAAAAASAAASSLLLPLAAAGGLLGLALLWRHR